MSPAGKVEMASVVGELVMMEVMFTIALVMKELEIVVVVMKVVSKLVLVE